MDTQNGFIAPKCQKISLGLSFFGNGFRLSESISTLLFGGFVMNQIDLSGLRDIRLPVQPDFWPLASGWYILIGCILMTVILGFIIWRLWQNKPLPYALRELKKIKQENKKNSLKELSQLLKRVAMAKHGRDAIAPLHEDEWQEFLLASAPQTLDKEQAKQLAYAIYNPNPKTPDKKLFLSCQKWIEKVLKK